MDEEQKEEKETRKEELKNKLKKEIKDELQSKMQDEIKTEIEKNARLLREEINTKDEKLDSMYKLLQKIDKTTSAPSTTGSQSPKTSGY